MPAAPELHQINWSGILIPGDIQGSTHLIIQNCRCFRLDGKIIIIELESIIFIEMPLVDYNPVWLQWWFAYQLSAQLAYLFPAPQIFINSYIEKGLYQLVGAYQPAIFEISRIANSGRVSI
jgi:hypothetical protein